MTHGDEFSMGPPSYQTEGRPRTVTRTTTRPIRNLKANRPWSGKTTAPAESSTQDESGVATEA